MAETGYVHKSKVQGESFEIGANVMYEGRQMTVSKAPDRDGDIRMNNISAVFALCDALPQMKALMDLKCAAMCRHAFLPAHRPYPLSIFGIAHTRSHLWTALLATSSKSRAA